MNQINLVADNTIDVIPVILPEEEEIYASQSTLNLVRGVDTFLDRLGKIMDNPDFRTFHSRYLKNWSDHKAAMMMMNTFVLIDESYTKKTGQKLNSDQIIFLLKKTMEHSQSRGIIVDSMSRFIKEEVDEFEESFQQVLKDSDESLLKLEFLFFLDSSKFICTPQDYKIKQKYHTDYIRKSIALSILCCINILLLCKKISQLVYY